MTLRIFVVQLLVAAWAAAVMAQGPSPGPTAPRSRAVDEARLAIQTSRTAYMNAIKGGDVQALANMLAPDAVMVSYDNAIASGRAEIGVNWAKAFQMAQIDEALDSDHVQVDADTAVDMGTIRITVRAPGQPPTNVVGKYVIVWQLMEGAWKLRRFACTADKSSPQSMTD